MANNKKYISLSKLSTFLDNLRTTFASLSHKHTINDITDYKVDSSLSSESNNPISNKAVDAEFEAISQAMGALDLAIDGKADSSHDHDDDYAARTHNHDGVYAPASHDHDNKYDEIGSAAKVQENLDVVSDNLKEHTDNTDIHVTTTNKSNWNSAYTHSTSAHARVDATKVEDSTTNGNIKINGTETNVYSHPNSGVTTGTYKSVTVNAQGHVTGGSNPTTLSGFGITDGETKSDASAKLTEAKTYADNAATKVKNDLLNGAGTAYDTLKELGDLIDDNQDAIDALEIVAAGKADKTHSHSISDVSGLQSALDGKAASSHGTHVTYSTTAPVMDGTASVGSASTVARSDHKHPTDTSRASKIEFDTHATDTTKHITSTERTNWNAAKTHADSAHAPSNAEKNQNAFSNIAVSGQTTVAADTVTDTVTFAGSNISITTDATNDKVTFSVADASTGNKGVVQLTNSTSSTSTTTAATPSSVKSAYDLANTAKTNAATAQSKADDAYSLAESKVDSLSDLGITATATELNYVDGVTSNVQSQIDNVKNNYLPLSGGTVTGTTVFSKVQDAVADSYNSPAVVIGGQPTQAHLELDNNEIQAKLSETKAGNLFLNSNGGTVHVGFDGLKIDSEANIVPEYAISGDVGTAELPFNKMYGRYHYVYGGENAEYGNLRVGTTGTASTAGVTTLQLGNNIATGTAHNASGKITMYGSGTAFTNIMPSDRTSGSNAVKLPSTSGTLATVEGSTKVATMKTAEYNALTADEIDTNTLYMLTDSEEFEIEDIPNLYVWKKYNSNPDVVKETPSDNVCICWKPTTYISTSFSIEYSDSISTDGGSISLVDKQVVSVNTADQANVLLGKYVYSSGTILSGELDDNEGYYFIPEDATFTIGGNNNSNLYVSKANKLSIPQYLSYVASKSFNTYTTGEQHTDGYWYKYIKQIGDSAVVDGSSVNFTETDPTVPAWAKTASKPSYTKSEVGLGNVDNTSDANKPVSTAQASAIADAKSAGTNAQSNLNTHTSNKSNPHGVTKAQVGLSNVDNVKQYSVNNPPPYPVTSVNGKTGAVTVKSVPDCSTSNNGQFLRVVNGVAAWSTVPNAEEATF